MDQEVLRLAGALLVVQRLWPRGADTPRTSTVSIFGRSRLVSSRWVLPLWALPLLALLGSVATRSLIARPDYILARRAEFAKHFLRRRDWIIAGFPLPFYGRRHVPFAATDEACAAPPQTGPTGVVRVVLAPTRANRRTAQPARSLAVLSQSILVAAPKGFP
jgi:hypothetical protein